MKKARLVVWYRSILVKQMAIFIFTLFTSVSIFMGIYYTFQTETIRKTAEITLSRDSRFLNEVENRLSEIEFQLYDLYTDGNLHLLCDLWDERYFCSAAKLEVFDITLLTIRAYDQVFGQMLTLFRILPVVFAVNIIAIIIFLFYIKRYVNRPVHILGQAFASIQEDENYLIEGAYSKDKFGVLYRGFNHMSSRLLENIAQNYKQKIELQRAQLKQLQAQIDPHFLYNTLFVLRTRVIRKDYDGVEELSGLLGDFFRFLNRDAKDFIALKSEIDHTYVYARIQATRYVERFMFVGDPCPEEYADVSVPRLILQPLIENAVKYEVETTENNGLIRVYFGTKGKKLLVILESSAITTDEAIRRMNEYVQTDDGVGEVTSTINIRRRLQLYYGKDHTLYQAAAQRLAKNFSL